MSVLAGSTGSNAAYPPTKRAAWQDGVGLPAGWREIRKLDVHSHVDPGLQRPAADWSSVEDLIEAANALGIETLFCSRPITGGAMAKIEDVRDANDSVLAAMKRYPERIEGYCFVQPGNAEAAVDELERCLDAGMIGVKLYNQLKYTNPVVFPIVERCIERRVPILGHSAYLTDARALAAQPRTSNAADFRPLHPLSRADTHPRAHQRRGRLGMGHQGSPRMPARLSRHERQRAGRRHDRPLRP